MKKIKRRATAVLVLVALLFAGLAVFVVRLWQDGRDWAMFRGNAEIYTNGVLNAGIITDRNGVVLARAGDGVFAYADDQTTRMSCLHAVGDYSGNIGTGALTALSDRLVRYSFVSGVSAKERTLPLTIDAELNNTAYRALWGRAGAVLVCNYKTGEILCMVSSPTYDPNVGPDPSQDGVYLNRTISAAYTPGSVFKLVTLTAALENIPDLDTRTFHCSGSVQVMGDTVKCTGVHGDQTIEQALAHSCNCAFAEISLELGPDTLANYAGQLGLTGAHSLDGIATQAGKFEKAEPGTSLMAWSGIGQYTDLVCPYSMLRLVSAIANGGQLMEPTLVGHKRWDSARQLLDQDTAERIRSMMDYNVQYAYGSGSFPGLSICAKTGTAETGDGASHGWFVGFLNDEKHPYAFVVVIEHGGGGLSAAGPVANAVLQAAVSK